ncbi:MAG TPA: multidrug effflux MFS transporter [Polyangiaceae bacterium]|nr:multidrug effflux MFS transporter [Polyangiaceae bacterium]
MSLSDGDAKHTMTQKPLSDFEFVALVALTTSLVAMSIDTMLPALGTMASELGATHANDRQLILSVFFGGMSLGQLIYGPVSDSTGRKPALYLGIGLFLLGGIICASTQSFTWLLVGRGLSGFGAAGPRIVSVALVRDAHTGSGMARVMSFVQTVFILVPVLAPSLGQAVLFVGSWRLIFVALVVIAALNAAWLGLRQPETLTRERRVSFSLRTIGRGCVETFRSRIALGYTLASGFVFGGFISYLSMSQQVFQEQYGLGTKFPVFFGLLASSIGVASFVNGKLVVRFGMRRLARTALLCDCALCICALLGTVLCAGHPPLFAFVGFMMVCFFCNGLLFGNFSARSMEPVGHIAGVASAVVGSVSGTIGLAFGTLFGRAYDGTVLPLVAGFTAAGLLALTVTEIAERGVLVQRAALPTLEAAPIVGETCE